MYAGDEVYGDDVTSGIVDDGPCEHLHVEKDDDGRDYWFYVCSDCGQVVTATEDGWEVME